MLTSLCRSCTQETNPIIFPRHLDILVIPLQMLAQHQSICKGGVKSAYRTFPTGHLWGVLTPFASPVNDSHGRCRRVRLCRYAYQLTSTCKSAPKGTK